MEATKPVHEQLKQEIVQLSQHLPTYLFSLPGIDPIRAVSLFGETDPITDFKRPSQLVAFAGLDLTVFQTGQYEASHRRISKRGSPFLRYTIWRMAYQAVYQEGDVRSYWLRKLSDGLTHRAAVTAAAIKLCRITWRILTDKRDYLTQGCPNQS
jgi:transposase